MFRIRFQRGMSFVSVAAAVLGLLILAGGTALRSEESPVIQVLTASATSSSADSLPVVDLLDQGKTGSWKPQALDSGADEGLFFQFREPVLIDWIEVTVKNGVANPVNLSYYLDGKLSGANKTVKSLKAKVRTVFIRLRGSVKGLPPEIVSVRFFRQGNKNPISVEVPISIKGQVIASSTLQPETAYMVQNLFDSRLDFAWSTDGKAREGVGEGFTIALERPQALSGLMIWNGYQRSDTHYAANTRPAKIKVTINGTKKIELALKDQMGHQILNFPQVEEQVKILNITAIGIYPGTVYKDMLISELKLIGADGRMILLDTPSPKIQTTHNTLNKIIDKSMSIYMLGFDVYYDFDYSPLQIRFRSNGSFVAYRGFDEVLEGNWEPARNGVRLFGKVYSTDPGDSIYFQTDTTRVESKIFQANVEIVDVRDLDYYEARKYFKTIMADRHFDEYVKNSKPSGRLEWLTGINKSVEGKDYLVLTGTTEDELMRQAYLFAVKRGAVLMISPLFTDIFLPGDLVDGFWVDHIEHDGTVGVLGNLQEKGQSFREQEAAGEFSTF